MEVFELRRLWTSGSSRAYPILAVGVEAKFFMIQSEASCEGYLDSWLIPRPSTKSGLILGPKKSGLKPLRFID